MGKMGGETGEERCQCVFRIVCPGETFSVLSHFLVQEFHGWQKTRADAFTDFHLDYFTHQLFEIVRLVIWNAENEIVSPVYTKCFQHCAPVQKMAPPHFSGSHDR